MNEQTESVLATMREAVLAPSLNRPLAAAVMGLVFLGFLITVILVALWVFRRDRDE